MKTLFTLVVVLVSYSGFSQGQFQKESVGFLGYFSGQVMQLADAIPADKYAWAPQTGVRSVAEVLTHIISTNYLIASKLGAKMPEGVKMETLEKDLKTKEAVVPELKRSYDLMIEAMKKATDASLSTKVEFPFPGEYTGMSAVLIAVTHTSEHLGQLIAYARMNKITPPWSHAQN